MALTAEEEAKARALLAAYDGRKSIDELPPLGDDTAFDLLVEVQGKDGESHKAQLAAMLPYVEDQCSYGIEWDRAVSPTPCTRVGNGDLHRLLPLQNRMKGSLLSDNGSIVERMNPSNWLAHDRSGARGQIQVQLPAFFYKRSSLGTKEQFRMSDLPLPGYKYYPGGYVGAYKASIERGTGKLCSVVNMGTEYRGGNNQTDWDGTNKTMLGKPVTMKSRTQFRTSARLRGTQWNANPYQQAYWAYVWLARVEYANLNCQLPFNAAKDANGYTQGGLGNGVTTLSSAEWNTFNAYYPLIPCGITDSLGNGSGEVAYDILNDDGTVYKTVYVNRYRGIECPYGDIWEWVDGIDVDILTDDSGGTSKLYVCMNPANFADSGDFSNYQLRGLLPRAEGYVKEILQGEYADIMPSAVGAGSTTYFCDYFYTNITANARRGVLFGGTANAGADAGFGCATSSDAPSRAATYIGSRLCFIPAGT